MTPIIQTRIALAVTCLLTLPTARALAQEAAPSPPAGPMAPPPAPVANSPETESPFAVEGALDRWVSFYYLNPEPELVPAAVRAIVARGQADTPEIFWPTAAFLAQIFRQNPTRVEDWAAELDDLETRYRHIVWAGLWMSRTSQGRQVIQLATEIEDAETKNALETALTSEPPDLLTNDLVSPQQLDLLWASFMATGDTRYVARVIGACADPADEAPSNSPDRAVASVSRVGLESYAFQHALVLAACREAIETQPEPVRIALKEVIAKVEERLATTPSPDPSLKPATEEQK